MNVTMFFMLLPGSTQILVNLSFFSLYFFGLSFCCLQDLFYSKTSCTFINSSDNILRQKFYLVMVCLSLYLSITYYGNRDPLLAMIIILLSSVQPCHHSSQVVTGDLNVATDSCSEIDDKYTVSLLNLDQVTSELMWLDTTDLKYQQYLNCIKLQC
jgi:hypothetical protein